MIFQLQQLLQLFWMSLNEYSNLFKVDTLARDLPAEPNLFVWTLLAISTIYRIGLIYIPQTVRWNIYILIWHLQTLVSEFLTCHYLTFYPMMWHFSSRLGVTRNQLFLMSVSNIVTSYPRCLKHLWHHVPNVCETRGSHC